MRTTLGLGKLREESINMEKIYNTMKNSGAACIAIGIASILLGVATGIIAIVFGAKLLTRKDEIVF